LSVVMPMAKLALVPALELPADGTRIPPSSVMLVP
jgi:hypothetical protein